MPDGQAVHAIGPDGKHYQFPAGYTEDQVNAHFHPSPTTSATPQPVTDLPTNQLVQQLNQILGVNRPGATQRFAEGWGIPTSKEELTGMAKDILPQSFGEAYKLLPAYMGPRQLWKMGKQYFGEDIPASLKALKTPGDPEQLRMVPVLGGALSRMGSDIQQGNVMGALGGGAAAVSQVFGPKAIKVAQELRPGLLETSERALSKGMMDVKQAAGHGGDVYIKASDQFGKLSDAIAAEHGATGKTFSIFDLQKELGKFGNQYNAGTTTPKFNAIYKEVMNSLPEMTWDELRKLRSRVGYMAAAAKNETPDAAAAIRSYEKISDRLRQGAEDVGRADEFDQMNRLWSGIRHYQDNGILDRLMKTGTEPAVPGGVGEGSKEFFDLLKDRSNRAKLNEINQAFSEFGMPDKYFRSMVDKFEPYRQYIESQQPARGGLGVLRRIISHPIAGTAGAIIGGTAGAATTIPRMGLVGAVGGGMGAVRMVDAIRAAARLSEMGGREAFPPVNALKGTSTPPRPLSQAAQEFATSRESGQPSGPAAPNAADTQTVADTLKTYFPKMGAKEMKEAATGALKASGGDVNQAVVNLLKQRGVSGGAPSPEAVKEALSNRGTYSRDPRTGKEILQSAQDIARASAKNSPAEAMAFMRQAAQNLFGKDYDSLTGDEKLKVVSEATRLQNEARKK